jgi:hypothetical protein
MNITKKLYSSATATSAMTLFSYLFSLLSGTNLREPHILAQLTGRLMPWRGKNKNILTGWLIHYAVGLLFSELYLKFWEKSSIHDKQKAGLIYGGLAGLAAILIWKFTLSVHPFPPAIHFGLFAFNLFLGHLVFGMVSALTIS